LLDFNPVSSYTHPHTNPDYEYMSAEKAGGMSETSGPAELLSKTRFTAAGLMSGTSMDGVDAALLHIDAHPDSPKAELIEFVTLDYPDELREALADVSIGHETTAEEIATINTGVGVTFSGSFFEVCRRAGVEPDQVDFIGSHGQTVAHVPPDSNAGTPVSGTLQLGSPSIIAALTGVTTVGDFRTGDIALGGQGAPLAPYADYLLRRSDSTSRIILNIGGIANLAWLPAGCRPADVVAFDTGPGNMVTDSLFQVLFPGEGRFDTGGLRAKEGKPSRELLDEFMENPYFEKPPPKSTGHRDFGAPFAWRFQSRGEQMGLSRTDILASGSELTSRTISLAVKAFVQSRGGVDAIYVSGGGAHNRAVLDGLEARLEGIACLPVDELGIPADAKEAVDFAVLARETLMGRPNVLPAVTGASNALVLGVIAWGART
jgi:anhydro-N-acetylmuramic acid kinase